MSDQMEVIVSSDSSGLLWNVGVWNSRTGTSLMSYKGGGVSAAHSVSLLGNDYLLAGEKGRPLLHAWPLNSQETLQQTGHIVCPGCIQALAVSPTNRYCVAGISEKLYIWEIASGRLMAVTARHYQSVTCIKFTDDGSHFASAGQDGMVLVWPLAYLISQHVNELFMQSEAGRLDPRYIFSDHSLPVTDLFIGHGGMRARMLSVSNDRTGKIYDLAGGVLLVSVVFDSALNAVTMNPVGTQMFVGAVNGTIYTCNLQNPPNTRDYHLSKEEKAVAFVGHSMTVTCLSASLDGLRLLSGSLDKNVMIWDIPSRQCIRTIQHKGPVNNAFFTILPTHVFSQAFKPSIILQSFKRSMEVSNDEPYTIVIMSKERTVNEDVPEYSSASTAVVVNKKSNLQDEINSLKRVNEELYSFAVEKLLQY